MMVGVKIGVVGEGGIPVGVDDVGDGAME